MNNTPLFEGEAKPWPSVDETKPGEEGGPAARSGFNYQDEIAVSFLIEMLETPSLLKVHCETHDDVLLLWAMSGSDKRLAEYVQVKASEPDKLWSVADLCQRKKATLGTSIFEKSLAHDRHEEESRFRLVTLRPVTTALKMLTVPLGAQGRDLAGVQFRTLCADLDERFPGLKSTKGNGVAFWLGHCYWDERHDEEAVRRDNLLRLLRLGVKEGKPLLPEAADVLVDELRHWAKTSGDAKWESDRDKKIIPRAKLRDWWERRTREVAEGGAATSGEKLATKMKDAGLPDELIRLAVNMRRGYGAESRTSRYLEPEEGERLQRRVKSEVMSLRARFVADQIDLDGVGFHSLCLERMDAVNAERDVGTEDRSAFLKGCMYDIADRCLLRFARPGR
jgi:hypothetical protein